MKIRAAVVPAIVVEEKHPILGNKFFFLTTKNYYNIRIYKLLRIRILDQDSDYDIR